MTGKNKPFRWGRLVLLFILIFCLIWVIGVFYFSNQYLNNLIHPGCELTTAVSEGFEKIQIPFHDKTLNGLWKPSKNGAVILIMGGHGSNETTMLREARFLSEAGYGTLTLNTRNCLGETSSFGWFELEEFNAAINEVQNRAPQAKIGVLGFSAGSVSSIRGTAAHQEVLSLVAIGNYASLAQEISGENRPVFSLGWQIERAVSLLYQIRFGISPNTINILPDLERIAPRPVLIIHGEKEAENNQAEAQKQAAGENAVLWIVPGSDHGEYIDLEPQAYPEIVINFFDETLK